MLQFALLAMQAAGMVTDWFATSQQVEMGRMGAQVEQAGISANIELTKAQAADASTQAMVRLRQSLGSQIAMQAARGNAAAGGTYTSLLNESESNFNADERTRRINLLSREAELKAQSTMSKLHENASENSLWGGAIKRSINTIGVSSLFDDSGSSGKGKRGVASAGSNGGSYGMTPI